MTADTRRVTYRDDRDALIEQTRALRREMQTAVAASGLLAAERDALRVEVEALREQVQALARTKRDGDAVRVEAQELSAERDGLKAEVESLRRHVRSAAEQRDNDDAVRRTARAHEARAKSLATELSIERARTPHGAGLLVVTTLVGAAVASFGWLIAGL